MAFFVHYKLQTLNGSIIARLCSHIDVALACVRQSNKMSGSLSCGARSSLPVTRNQSPPARSCSRVIDEEGYSTFGSMKKRPLTSPASFAALNQTCVFAPYAERSFNHRRRG